MMGGDNSTSRSLNCLTVHNACEYMNYPHHHRKICAFMKYTGLSNSEPCARAGGSFVLIVVV